MNLEEIDYVAWIRSEPRESVVFKASTYRQALERGRTALAVKLRRRVNLEDVEAEVVR